MTYGEIFRLQRRWLNMSLQEVAKASGVAVSTLSRFERGGDIHFSLLVKASRAIKLSLDDIADGEEGCLPATKKDKL